MVTGELHSQRPGTVRTGKKRRAGSSRSPHSPSPPSCCSPNSTAAVAALLRHDPHHQIDLLGARDRRNHDRADRNGQHRHHGLPQSPHRSALRQRHLRMSGHFVSQRSQVTTPPCVAFRRPCASSAGALAEQGPLGAGIAWLPPPKGLLPVPGVAPRPALDCSAEQGRSRCIPCRCPVPRAARSPRLLRGEFSAVSSRRPCRHRKPMSNGPQRCTSPVETLGNLAGGRFARPAGGVV